MRQLATREPIPVVVCSSYVPRGSEAALTALEQGALGIVEKPRVGVKSFLEESATRVVDSVRAAAQARARRRAAFAPRTRLGRAASGRGESVLAIGASTGGPDALRLVVEALPPEAPGTAIVQHMPAGFTRAFADRLNRGARVEVKEAEAGDELSRGRVLIAPGDRHLRVHRAGKGYEVEVAGGPLVSRHRPSVDVLFHSVAEAAGRDAVGVILTGMGEDGARGLLAMREAGARTFAQDEESCAVYGMPKAAVALGAVDEICSLAGLPERILRRARTAGATVPGSGADRSLD
jgi:two-component system chemotaxis response regulator CheB